MSGSWRRVGEAWARHGRAQLVRSEGEEQAFHCEDSEDEEDEAAAGEKPAELPAPERSGESGILRCSPPSEAERVAQEKRRQHRAQLRSEVHLANGAAGRVGYLHQNELAYP